jgi:glucose-1-phosphate thymidylyltransferase
MREIAKPMLKNQYGQYLLRVIDEMKEEINSNTLEHV